MESMREAFEMSFLHNHLCGQWHWTLHLSKCFICLWWRGWLSCAWACSLVKLNRVRCVCRHNLSQMFSLSQLWKSSNNIVFVLETSVWRWWSKSQLRIKTVQLLTWNSYLISRYQWIPTIRQIVVERFGMNGLNFGVIWRQQSGPSGAQAYYGESIGSIEALWPFMVVPHQKHFMANYRSLAANHW